MLLLDTHVWIWILAGDARRIGRRARALLTRAESRDAIRISPVTLFEVMTAIAITTTTGQAAQAIHPPDGISNWRSGVSTAPPATSDRETRRI